MPLSRSSFGPCSERTRSMNISKVAPGIGSSVAKVKARMRVVVAVDVVVVMVVMVLPAA